MLGLELVRHYNSQDAHRGLVGANWRSSYEAVLYDFGRQLQIVQADGRRIMFERPAAAHKPTDKPAGATSSHTADPQLCSSTDPADGQVRIHTDAQGQNSYHWRWPDGRELTFSSGRNGGHPLQSIRAASGELLSLHYAPGGELLKVTDPQGRSLHLGYDRQGQLQTIRTPLGELHYRRDAQYRLTEVQSGTRSDRAGSVDSAAQRHTTRRYHYESERQSGHANALTGISLVSTEQGQSQGKTIEQRLSTYAYDAQGRAVLSTKGWPKDSADHRAHGKPEERGIEQITVEYRQAALPRPGKTNPDGEYVPAQVGRIVLTNSLG